MNRRGWGGVADTEVNSGLKDSELYELVGIPSEIYMYSCTFAKVPAADQQPEKMQSALYWPAPSSKRVTFPTPWGQSHVTCTRE